MRYAASLGYRVKLLGRVKAVGDKVAAYVAPHLVGVDNLLAAIDGVTNGIVVRGNAAGDVVFCGAGAGKLPTASAVAADIVDAVKHMHSRKLISWEEGGADLATDPALLESSWYIRTNVDRAMIEREFGEVMFAPDTGSEISFKTTVMNGKMIADHLGRGIPALSKFRVLGDY
jgi:homoserine dehydrogenase